MRVVVISLLEYSCDERDEVEGIGDSGEASVKRSATGTRLARSQVPVEAPISVEFVDGHEGSRTLEVDIRRRIKGLRRAISFVVVGEEEKDESKLEEIKIE